MYQKRRNEASKAALTGDPDISELVDELARHQLTASGKMNEASTHRTAALEKELMLHEAVIMNDAEVVRKVLQDSDDLNVNCRNNYGRAPIHLAASRGNPDILGMLIKAKCDIEAIDKFGLRPLHMAAWHGQRDAVELLLKAGACISTVDKKQRTLLMMASRSKSDGSFLEYVIGKLEGSAEARAQDAEGASALHHAARVGQTQAIQALARLVPDLDVNARDQHGETALHYACAAGQQEAASHLLDLGASLRDQDSEGSTALHLAVHSRDSQLCSWLLARCSEAERPLLLRLGDQRGFTLLHVAASLGCSRILGSLLQYENRLHEALDTRCRQGNTPLHLAAQHDQPQVVEMLVERGAALDSLNKNGQTPLQLASEMSHSQICRVLLAAGAGSNASGESSADGDQEPKGEEKTTLHVAAKSSLARIANMIARTARLDYPGLFLQGTRALFNNDEE